MQGFGTKELDFDDVKNKDKILGEQVTALPIIKPLDVGYFIFELSGRARKYEEIVSNYYLVTNIEKITSMWPFLIAFVVGLRLTKVSATIKFEKQREKKTAENDPRP